MKLTLKEYEEKMKKSLTSLEGEFGTIRAGKANASVLDKVRVDYCGSLMPINQVAEIKIPEPRMLVIQPWDASLLKAIDKAITASELGITPTNDGKIIRLAFPQPTEERRKELSKQVEKIGEEAKIALRNIRRDANDKIKDMKKKGEMTEDEQKASEKDTQVLTDKYTKLVDDAAAKKKKEIMEI